MKTHQIKIFYQLTQTQIIPPPQLSIDLKDRWIKDIQKTIEADWKPRFVEVTYRVINPDVEQQRKFFNGPVVEYYAIQSTEGLEGRPAPALIKKTRETILSDALGYDVQLLDRVERRRKSTSEFTQTQQWHDFLETLRETIFEPEGYEFPDSTFFWDIAKKHSYTEAKDIVAKMLQERIARKLSTDQTHGK